VVLTRVEDQGIRGGDRLSGLYRLRCAHEGSDNPARSTRYYGFRTFLPSRLPLQERGST